MRIHDFQPGHPGRLVREGHGDAEYYAYVPAELPAELEWTERLVATLSAADRALGRLAGVAQNLPNPRLLIGPFVRREAVLSSRIEGTQASLADLLLFEASPDTRPQHEDVREVANYIRAMEHGLARLKTFPLSLRLIREMHAILMEGVRGQERAPGEFRTSQNWIGPPGCTLADATFVPAPPHELPDALSAFERYLHTKSQMPSLIRLAIIHYQFEAIHPFLDGNGRIGRLLITLLLCLEGALPGPLLYLSAYFERSRGAYYAGLLGVSREGRWTDWVEFFLRGVTEQAMDAVQRADHLIALRESFRGQLLDAKASARALRLMDELFHTPALSVTQASRLLRITPRAAQMCVDRLVGVGILKEVTNRKRHRVYVAREIARTVQ